jgi:hypothetical protein
VAGPQLGDGGVDGVEAGVEAGVEVAVVEVVTGPHLLRTRAAVEGAAYGVGVGGRYEDSAVNDLDEPTPGSCTTAD